MLSELEKKILEKVSDSQLITKEELRRFLKNNGSGSAVDSATQNLVSRELLAEVAPIGSTCFVITQKGTRYVNELG